MANGTDLPPPADRRERIKILHEQIFTLIWFAFRRLAQRLQSYGLTQPQFVTLAALVRHGSPATMRQLTQVTFQDPPTMTGIVNRLVKAGLVDRTRSEEDRRVVWVNATPDGVALLKTIVQHLEQEDPYQFHTMSDDEIIRMEEFLDYILTRYISQIFRQETRLEVAKEQLRGFARDPIGFVNSYAGPERS
ncbi:MAG: MarR family transcriptional regulator [Caldilineae bacterium]|nr:MAG: MarR family transcriptional regulator [Caldilineae bacterium]